MSRRPFEFPTDVPPLKHGRRAFGINVIVGLVLGAFLLLVGWASRNTPVGIIAVLVLAVSIVGAMVFLAMAVTSGSSNRSAR